MCSFYVIWYRDIFGSTNENIFPAEHRQYNNIVSFRGEHGNTSDHNFMQPVIVFARNKEKSTNREKIVLSEGKSLKMIFVLKTYLNMFNGRVDVWKKKQRNKSWVYYSGEFISQFYQTSLQEHYFKPFFGCVCKSFAPSIKKFFFCFSSIIGSLMRACFLRCAGVFIQLLNLHFFLYSVFSVSHIFSFSCFFFRCVENVNCILGYFCR